jgi:hypothetical protein
VSSCRQTPHQFANSWGLKAGLEAKLGAALDTVCQGMRCARAAFAHSPSPTPALLWPHAGGDTVSQLAGRRGGHRSGAPFQCGCSLMHPNPGPPCCCAPRPAPSAAENWGTSGGLWRVFRLTPTLVPPQISVTSGVVSRIEVTAYAHGATELLGVQIDAAINSGNSGGCASPPTAARLCRDPAPAGSRACRSVTCCQRQGPAAPLLRSIDPACLAPCLMHPPTHVTSTCANLLQPLALLKQPFHPY